MSHPLNGLHRALLLVLAATLLLALPAAAKNETLFTLVDPAGDDHGDGRMVYPLRTEYAKGDLDLVKLEAIRVKEGTRFEATFARPIRVPERVAVDGLGTQLTSVARNGFYTFNIDIYIDTDREQGSGWVGTLPGRKAEIAEGYGWERAVVLTPRPNEAKLALETLMVRTLSKELRNGEYRGEELAQARDELRRTLPHDLARQVFFPDRTRVRGNTISFTVPDRFLGGPARDDWSYVVVVSGADLIQSLDISAAFGLAESSADSLMILPISPGTWQDRFGGGREFEDLQPPLVDIVVPSSYRQERVLGDFSTTHEEPVQLPGVVPAEQAAGASSAVRGGRR